MLSNSRSTFNNLFLIFICLSSVLIVAVPPNEQRPNKYNPSTRWNIDYLRWREGQYRLPEAKRVDPEHIHEPAPPAPSEGGKKHVAGEPQDIAEDDKCCICMSELIEEGQEPGDKSKLTYCKKQCGAWMHQECMNGWAANSNNRNVICPLCKADWRPGFAGEDNHDRQQTRSSSNPLLSPIFTPPKPTEYDLSKSLAIVSTLDDYNQWNQVYNKPLIGGVTQAVNYLKDERVTSMVSLNPEEYMDQLFKVFEKYSIPIGILPSLLDLTTAHVIEILVGGVTGGDYSDVILDIQRMVEIIAYLPIFNNGHVLFTIKFQYKQGHVRIVQSRNETPREFMSNVYTQLFNAVYNSPVVTDKSADKLLEGSYASYHRDMKVARYFYGSAGLAFGERALLVNLVHQRQNGNNPLTFISLGTSASEWMRRVATSRLQAYRGLTRCAFVDEYSAALRHMKRTLSPSFPYTKGLHLGIQLISVFDPDTFKPFQDDQANVMSADHLSRILGYPTIGDDYNYFLAEQPRSRRRFGGRFFTGR